MLQVYGELSDEAKARVAAFDSREWFSLNEASQILHVSTRTLQRWLRNGLIHGNRIGPGCRWRFSAAELRRVLDGEGGGENDER